MNNGTENSAANADDLAAKTDKSKKEEKAVEAAKTGKNEKEERGRNAAENNAENSDFAEENLFTTLHPKGSLNDRLYFNPNRMLVRPDLHLKRVLIKVFAVLVVAVVCAYLLGEHLKRVGVRNYLSYAALTGAGIVLIFVVAFLKDIFIWLVKVYQKFAPEAVRRKCVFTPSCSEYMILSLEKYGAIRGLIKGIKRLKRCHLPNHGEDYP